MSETPVRHVCLGLLAHVDAGKTTLSEQLLYRAHAIRQLGRVDHGSAFLDDHPIERERGITVFSGQACMTLGDASVTLLDTPGHADFSTEMERAVSVMDAAVLVISCAEGVQSHTETVWSLLKAYRVPVLLFLNKTDRTGADPQRVLAEIHSRLTADTVDLRGLQSSGALNDEETEAIAALDEDLLERFFEGTLTEAQALHTLRQKCLSRQCFPVLAGSGLTGDGVDGLIRLLQQLMLPDRPAAADAPLSARVFRIRHEDGGGRLCFLKLLSGSIRVRDLLPVGEEGARVNELRIYHGSRFHTVPQAEAGQIVAIPGLEGLAPGDGLGGAAQERFITMPMMAADLIWDSKALPSFRLMEKLRPLGEEEPSLRFEERDGRISCRVMGRIQLEILRRQLQDRCGVAVDFGPCRVVYRETIAAPAIGIGHYEPLRHYAEVVLRLKPGQPGSGITFRSCCHVDALALNWQRLIETHIFERPYHGVLTGAELTDIEIELVAGRAHLKHTEGGDFRQAVGRAVRNGLMYAESVLLEPVASFEITCPRELWGTVTAPLNRLQADLMPPEDAGLDSLRLRGELPLGLFMTYQDDFSALTHGRGSLRFHVEREAPCRDAQRVIDEAAYNPLAADTPDSVFCTHGAGIEVAWYKVREWAHSEGAWRGEIGL